MRSEISRRSDLKVLLEITVRERSTLNLTVVNQNPRGEGTGLGCHNIIRLALQWQGCLQAARLRLPPTLWTGITTAGPQWAGEGTRQREQPREHPLKAIPLHPVLSLNSYTTLWVGIWKTGKLKATQ